MADIYITYAQADWDRINLVARGLEKFGWSVYWTIPSASNSVQQEEANHAFATAAYVLVAWSKQSLDDTAVRVAASDARDSRRLVSVYLDVVTPPAGFNEVPFAFLTDWQGDRNDRAWRDLLTIIKQTPTDHKQHGAAGANAVNGQPRPDLAPYWSRLLKGPGKNQLGKLTTELRLLLRQFPDDAELIKLKRHVSVAWDILEASIATGELVDVVEQTADQGISEQDNQTERQESAPQSPVDISITSESGYSATTANAVAPDQEEEPRSAPVSSPAGSQHGSATTDSPQASLELEELSKYSELVEFDELDQPADLVEPEQTTTASVSAPIEGRSPISAPEGAVPGPITAQVTDKAPPIFSEETAEETTATGEDDGTLTQPDPDLSLVADTTPVEPANRPIAATTGRIPPESLPVLRNSRGDSSARRNHESRKKKRHAASSDGQSSVGYSTRQAKRLLAAAVALVVLAAGGIAALALLRPPPPELGDTPTMAAADAAFEVSSAVPTREQAINESDLPRLPDLASIPAGCFRMGSSRNENRRFSSEGPIRVVCLDAFAISRHEVTFLQYDAYASDTGARNVDDQGWGRLNRPVIKINWAEAVAYTDWLSEQLGQTCRLPTEAEWEYAARAKTVGPYGVPGPDGSDKIAGRQLAVCGGCGTQWDSKQTAPVGMFPANQWGLYDMHGNVWEWVEDCWHDSYSGAPADGSAWIDVTDGDTVCPTRVLRGGSWGNVSVDLRSARRYRYLAEYFRSDIGFRVVCVPKHQAATP